MTQPATESLDQARIRSAKIATAGIFAVNGLGIATFLSRLPAVRDNLGLSPSGLALVFISGSLGAVLALPLSGPLVHRLGSARMVRSAAMLCLAGIAVAGVAGGGLLGGVPLLAVGLFGFGVGNALWDVSMNVEAAVVEQRVGRAIMPRFHAGFSLGTVAGAGLGAAAAAVGLSVTAHYGLVCLGILVAVLALVRRFLPPGQEVREASQPASAPGEEPVAAPTGSGTLAAWRERRTLLVGLLALGMAMAEGSANDWLAIGFKDGYVDDDALAALGLGVFVTAMTVGRLVGPGVLDRLGRVRALRGGALLVLLGVLAFIVGASVVDTVGVAAGLPLGVVGALAWGLGASLGFPVAMSAAADDPARAPARVSVVASLGYVAFLAGPPFLGLLGDRVGVVRAMSGVLVAVVLALLCAGAARPAVPGEAAAAQPAARRD